MAVLVGAGGGLAFPSPATATTLDLHAGFTYDEAANDAPSAFGAPTRSSHPRPRRVFERDGSAGSSPVSEVLVVATEDGERTYDWRKLGNREFENFFGESAEDVKKDIVGSGGSKFDLYEDKCTGEIFVLRKGGVGEPQPTGYRFPK